MPQKSKRIRKSMRKNLNLNNNSNNNNNTGNNNRRSMRSKSKGRSNKGSKKKSSLGTVDLKNLDNNKFYCVKCGGAVKCNGVKIDSKVMKNGCQRLVAQCSKCNMTVYRILPKKSK